MTATDTRTWTLVIPVIEGVIGWPVSPNSRHHWAVKALINGQWRAAVYGACHEQQIPHLERAHVTVTFRTARGRLGDPDNRVASCKALIDGLVGCYVGKGSSRVLLPGILEDDDTAHLELTVREERVKVGQEAIVLEIAAPIDTAERNVAQSGRRR